MGFVTRTCPEHKAHRFEMNDEMQQFIERISGEKSRRPTMNTPKVWDIKAQGSYPGFRNGNNRKTLKGFHRRRVRCQSLSGMGGHGHGVPQGWNPGLCYRTLSACSFSVFVNFHRIFFSISCSVSSLISKLWALCSGQVWLQSVKSRYAALHSRIVFAFWCRDHFFRAETGFRDNIGTL